MNTIRTIIGSVLYTGCHVMDILYSRTSNKGHSEYRTIEITSLQRTRSRASKIDSPIVLIHSTSEELTTSLQWTNYLVPMCPL